MKYVEKLKDPRWQKKRLEIMERDDFKCMICGSGTKTLHVHHIKYVKGKEPWEYDSNNFKTLCDSCHEAEHNEVNIKNEGIININELIDLMPELNYYFTDICNHKGVWTFKVRDSVDIDLVKKTIHKVMGYAWFDNEFNFIVNGRVNEMYVVDKTDSFYNEGLNLNPDNNEHHKNRR